MTVYWLEQSEANVPPENDWMSAAERERWQSMRLAKRRSEWRLGRWTAKQAAAAWLRLPASLLVLAQIEIVAAADGAPEVFVSRRPAALSISLSHRAGTALCTIAPTGALGCDLEMIEAHSDAFVADYFTPEEQRWIASADAEERDRLVAILWSGKEGALKALRVGLRMDTRDFTVTLPAGASDAFGWGALAVRSREGRIFQGWWRENGEFVRTVVAEGMALPPLQLDRHAAWAACA